VRTRLLALLLFAVPAVASVQTLTLVQLPPPDREIPLYEGTAPGSEKWNWDERTFIRQDGYTITQNVVHPVLQYFAPDPAKACGTMVVVAPGGGHTNLVIMEEGRDIVRQLKAMGISAFILKYRLIHVAVQPNSPLYVPEKRANGVILTGAQKGQNYFDLERDDGRAAMCWLRAHAGEFGCDPHRIGFLGSSAGGAVALGAVFGPPETRPDFAALIAGPYQLDHPVAPDAPPLFLAASSDDAWGAEGSLVLFRSWRAAKRPAEIHIFQTGGHGFLKKGGGGDHVIDRVGEWMHANGWMTKP